jgi:hypothetical protein
MLRYLICSSGDSCGHIHQRGRSGAVALVVLAAGVVLDAAVSPATPPARRAAVAALVAVVTDKKSRVLTGRDTTRVP